eukprot:7382655-Prymnesium_polylepis.1
MVARVVDFNPIPAGSNAESLKSASLVRWLRLVGFDASFDHASARYRAQLDRTCGVVAARAAAIIARAGHACWQTVDVGDASSTQ